MQESDRVGGIGLVLACGWWVPQLITEVFVSPILGNCFCLFGRLVLSVAKPNKSQLILGALANYRAL